MKIDFLSPPLALSLLAILTIIACGLPVSTASPAAQPTITQNLQTEPVQTEIVQPTFTFTAEVGQETTIASPGPSCTVLQDLNLRSGPGTAYRPPIKALRADSVVTPLGFAPQGIPGGSWAYVQDVATQDKGWVSAGSQYISCNVELATLPSVAFGTPPPPPLPKSAQTSDPDGNGFCVDQPSDYLCVGVFSEQSLFQFQILKNGIEQGQNDGVEPVSFRVSRIPSDDPSNKVLVYEKTENQRPYCIFGDNQGVCNSWVSEDGVYKWTKGGTPIEPGEYEMEVNATVNGESSRWAVNFTLTVP
ncbi:MAG TPA: SH3 domain-containing protein [Anaerolineales bacterium]|nr:SH3 domain-containing protein [Anaerolineales bacterium]